MNTILNRPSWDEYYLTIAWVVSQRSFDPSTKCGCVLVSRDNAILSTGYNGPIQNSNDKDIPLTRPDKYYHFIHSEENALLAYNGSHQDIINATAYITGHPCHRCLRMLLRKGITQIVYTPHGQAKCIDVSDLKAQKIMLKNRNIKIKKIPIKTVQKLLHSTDAWIKSKEV
jgi:dCMP deaminase